MMELIDNFIFGRNFSQKSDKLKVEILKSNLYFVIFLSFSIILTFTSSFFIIYILDEEIEVDKIEIINDSINNQVKINIDNLTSQDEEMVFNSVVKLKPPFLFNQKSITFTYNLSRYTTNTNVTNWNGFFDRRGNSYILFRNNTKVMEKTLCHELLHNYFKYDETSHDILNILAKERVCYYS